MSELTKMEIKAKSIIEKLKVTGYVFAEKGKGLLPINDFKDVLVLLADVLNAILNKKMPITELLGDVWETWKGKENIGVQFLDIDEDEVVECYIAFASKFDIENIESEPLELFIEKSFFSQLMQAQAIAWLVNNKTLPGVK